MLSSKDKNIKYIQKIENLEHEVYKLKSAVEELSVLNDLAIAAGRTVDLDKLLNIIVQKTILSLKAEQAAIQLVTPNKGSPLNTLIRREAQSSIMPSYKVGNYITGWILKNKKQLIIEDLANDDRFKTTPDDLKVINSVMGVPIWLKAEIIGVFILTNKKTKEPFNSNDLKLLTIIASQAAQLILNSQLQEEAIEKKKLEYELNLARKIQMSLLPKSRLKIPQLDIDCYFLSSDAVGGDYYDYFMINDNKFCMVIADVSGHGPSAALMMTMLKGILHSITSNFISPDIVLKEINSIFSRIAPAEMFVTMMFLIFDLENRKLQFSNAGHNPLLFFNAGNNSCEVVKLAGCALNISINSNFAVREIPLNTNDLFVIYTDGITEAVNEKSEMFGLNKLVRIIDEVKEKTTAGIIEHVKTQLYDFAKNQSLEDDIAFIAVKVKE